MFIYDPLQPRKSLITAFFYYCEATYICHHTGVLFLMTLTMLNAPLGRQAKSSNQISSICLVH